MAGIKGRSGRKANSKSPPARNSGYYWVKFRIGVKFLDTVPEIGRWDGSTWMLLGSGDTFDDEDLQVLEPVKM